MATRSRARGDGLGADELTELFKPHDPLLRAGSWVHTQLGNQISYGYLARRLVSMGQTSRAMDMAAAISDFSTQFEIYGLLFRATEEPDRARESLVNALRANPLNMQARYSLVSDHLEEMQHGDTLTEEILEAAAQLTGAPAAVIEGLAYQTDADWASLAALDEVLAQSIVTDRWHRDVARLRAAWRVNATEDRERLAFEAMQIIEQILTLTADDDLHRMRAMAAGVLGDVDRLVESSNFLLRFNSDILTAMANEGQRLSAEEHTVFRQNLVVIANSLSGELEAADPERLAEVRRNANGLIEYLDDYPLAAEE